jgi:triosephosphate isomerase
LLIVGNWKMNGTAADLTAFRAVAGVARARPPIEIVLCPPFTMLAAAVDGSNLRVGAQDCHVADFGSHTGCISASMIKATGAEFVLIGHSERREQFGESDETVAAKAAAASRADLTPIICVGETASQRAAGATQFTLAAQLQPVLATLGGGFLIAYEPRWAIGTSRTPSNQEIKEAVDFLKGQASAGPARGDTKVLYGGSVDERNTSRLCEVEGIDGLLVGRASLDPTTFSMIVTCAHLAMRPS